MSYENKDINIKQRILNLLKEKPGLKARELANYLNVDKKLINSALYGPLNSQCIQDEKYCWYLKSNNPKKVESNKKEVSTTILTNLSNYYLSCLSNDCSEGIRAFANGDFGLDYVELNYLPTFESNISVDTDKIQNLLGKIRKDRSRLELYFTYPVYLKKVVSKKSNWEGMIVEPILLFPVEVNNSSLKVTQNFPIFNLNVLKKFTNSEREQIMDDLLQIEEELNLNSENDMPELDDLVMRLNTIRPEWPWKEKIDTDNLITEPPLKDVKNEGIYNRAILIVGERSKYTQGLESELKSLSSIHPDVYEKTILGKFIKSSISENHNEDDIPLLEVLPLNSEQQNAIKSSLDNQLTVITGPPGTGKSQVVTNLLINAAWRGKKVLFASKNNKAVDVVETRVNNLGKIPILLRMGSGEYHTKLAEYLMNLLSSNVTYNEKEEYDYYNERYKNLEEKIKLISKDEEKLIKLRNETDRLDQYIDTIRKSIPNNIYENIKEQDAKFLKNMLHGFKDTLDFVDKYKQTFITRLFWNFIKKERYKKLKIDLEIIEPFAKKLGIELPDSSINNINLKLLRSTSNDIANYIYFIEKVEEYSSSLKQLQSTKSLEEISYEKINLMKEMSSNAENLWNSWLKLQPERLSNEDRNLLSNYTALLKMVIEAGSDIYNKLGKKIYIEYSNISKKVSHLLPAWAITSLSARGKIPFEAGYFDIVIFDEASQCDIASALPLLYRAKQAVIIGDPKQLRHISSLQKGKDQQLLEKYGLIPNHAKWAYSYNSLFDLAAGLVTSNSLINLKDHHRSHSDIIEFSNKEFYEGNLRVATNYDNLNFIKNEKNGIRWSDIEGDVKKPSTGGAVNEKEAKAVINELEKLIYKRNYKGTIGVVTPFRAQANLIRRLINKNTDLENRLINNKFLVDTVHKFQGDERDIMIFSTVVSKNMPTGALGFLRNTGNLFNVAITRARAMLVVVGDKNAAQSCGINYLENFAKYSQELEQSIEKEVSQNIRDLGEEYPIVANPERVSEWEHILYKELYKKGIKVIPQYQIEKYTLDFALFKDDRRLDIEVDGERYHKNWTGELCKRDQIRNQRLFELGWDVKRFWVYEIRDDIKGCIETIEKWINKD